jgi:enoyl-CoA hydratase/carnithine racemase
MQTALFDAMDTATEDPHVRVIVLTGAGRGFCPGADMQHLASLAEGSQDPAGTVASRPITYAMSVPKPIVCAINGAWAGIGLAVQ